MKLGTNGQPAISVAIWHYQQIKGIIITDTLLHEGKTGWYVGVFLYSWFRCNDKLGPGKFTSASIASFVKVKQLTLAFGINNVVVQFCRCKVKLQKLIFTWIWNSVTVIPLKNQHSRKDCHFVGLTHSNIGCCPLDPLRTGHGVRFSQILSWKSRRLLQNCTLRSQGGMDYLILFLSVLVNLGFTEISVSVSDDQQHVRSFKEWILRYFFKVPSSRQAMKYILKNTLHHVLYHLSSRYSK